MRTTLIILHRWLALIAAIAIIVVALSGAALTFEGAIDRALNPSLWRVTAGTARVPLDTIAAHARATVPKVPLTGIGLSSAANRATVAQVGPMQVFVDPYTGLVLGTRDVREFQKTLPRRLHVLHTALLAGERGSAVVAWMTVAVLVLLLSGIVLWWPDKLVAIHWSASWKRIVFDLHHLLGIATVAVLLVVASSGVVVHFDSLRAAIGRLDRTTPPPAEDQSEAAAGAVNISLDSLATVGLHTLPGAAITFLNIPPRADQPFVVSMRFPEDRTPGGRSRVLVDRFTGQTLLVQNTRLAEPGTRMNNVLRSVHTGDLYGNTTRALWVLATLVLVHQAVSGVFMWWNARRARAARARAGDTRAPAAASGA